jgi:glutamate racemase
MSPNPSNAPIAILDSGLGGLSVARCLRALLPHERLVYFGDTARTPYGWKSTDTVTAFVRQMILYVRRYEPKHVVIGCNTATALALPLLRAEFPELSISGVIEPGARAAIEVAGAIASPLMAIMATEATIWSKAYERAIHRRRHHARLLLRPAPLLVPLVEEGRERDDALVKLALEQYLVPLVQRGADVLILGCTHYALLKPQIRRIVGSKLPLIDSAKRCAEDVARRLQAANVLSGGVTGGGGATTGSLECIVTDDHPRFRTLAARFLGEEPDPPTLVTPDELSALSREAAAAVERHPLRKSA